MAEKVIFITSGSTWTIPEDWNNSNYKIEAIGGGAGGGLVRLGNNDYLTGGGGAGAYAKLTNASEISFTYGSSVSYSVGAGGVGAFNGGDTWFKNTSTLLAKAGSAAVAGTTDGGVGGLATACIPTSGAKNGGVGGRSVWIGGQAGGGGAGGPDGAGGNGSDAGISANAGGGGGGGANGGGTAVRKTGSLVGCDGANSGGSSIGIGGTGAINSTTAAVVGGIGSGGGGGGGGYYSNPATTFNIGAAGGAGAYWTATNTWNGSSYTNTTPTAGPGGGGGGSSYNINISGNGGNYGGGGGSAYASYTASNGAPGIIVVTYTPFEPYVVPSAPVTMDDIAKAFLSLGDVLPAKPWGLGSYYAKNLSAGQGKPQDLNTRTLNYVYGSLDGTLTEKISTGGTINFGQFASTYQNLSMRLATTMYNGTAPTNQLYTQYDQIIYTYTGYSQTFNFYNARVIQIECWGGPSGVYSAQNYNKGGYAIGVYVAPTGGSLYVYVGGSSNYPNRSNTFAYVSGGWNGGGSSYHFQENRGLQPNAARASGGGATDVRTRRAATDPPFSPGYLSDGVTQGVDSTTWTNYWGLSNTIDSLTSRLIVAGGAGGLYYYFGYYSGGSGGGSSGGDGVGDVPGGGGFPSGPGAFPGNVTTYGMINAGFGYGGSKNTTTTSSLGGGGGGWYGGAGGNAGGGGSGYISGSSMLPDSNAAGSRNFGVNTYNVRSGQTGYVTIPDASAGNGLVRITILG